MGCLKIVEIIELQYDNLKIYFSNFSIAHFEDFALIKQSLLWIV